MTVPFFLRGQGIGGGVTPTGKTQRRAVELHAIHFITLKMRGLDQHDGPRGKDFIIVRALDMLCIWCLVMTLPTMGHPDGCLRPRLSPRARHKFDGR